MAEQLLTPEWTGEPVPVNPFRVLVRDYLAPNGKVLRVSAKLPVFLVDTVPASLIASIDRDFEDERQYQLKKAGFEVAQVSTFDARIVPDVVTGG